MAEARTEFDQFTTELLLELPSPKHPDYCCRVFRADVIGKKDDETHINEVTVDARDALSWDGIFPKTVRVNTPLVWYGVEFAVTGAVPDEKELIAWTSRWIDVLDARYVEGAEFQSVVHSVTPPATSSSGFQISVDFGSAPTDAFDELVALLSRDAQSVAVGSFFLFDHAKEEKKA